MSLRLKWKGIEEVSPKGKEVIENRLKLLGQITILTTYMPRTTAQKIAKLNDLTLDYRTIIHKGRPTEHYVFQIDSQRVLRKELKRRRRLRFWENLTITWILVFLFSLLVQIFLWD